MTDKTEADILKRATERFDRAIEAESDNRASFEEDVRFSNGDQWPEDILRERKAKRKPCLTINKIPAFIRQVTNEARQMRPAIKVRGVDSAGDPEQAEILNGMIRAIEQASNAEAAYDWAVEYAVRGGWGYWRIDVDYEDDNSFEQCIQINRVRDHLSVYLDPDAEQADGSDARWGFIVDWVDEEQFRADYPDADTEWFAGLDDRHDQWYTDGKVRIAEYYEIEEARVKQLQLSDGSVVYEDEAMQNVDAYLQAGIAPVQERDAVRKTLVHRLITAGNVLEETRYEGRSYVPLVRVVGEELWEDGRMLYQGMVKDMKDPQRQFNYWRTASAERGALSTKSPWIGPKGSFEDPKWQTANVENYAYLEYDPQAGGDRPWREPGLDVSAAFVQEVMQASDDLKAVTGIYDSSMGNQSNEIAGVAIKERRRESDVANFHYLDNLGRAMRYTGKILVELIPLIYAGPRVMTILQEDGAEEEVQLNQPYYDPNKNRERMIDLSAGKYDVSVDVGPSYATQREEAASSMMELLSAFPQAAPVIGDLVAKNMDWPDADTISERLKLLLPPEVAQGENPQIAQIIAQKDQEVQMAQQQVGMAQQQLQAMMQELQSRDREHQLKLAELEEKIRKNDLDHVQKMSKLEGEYQTPLPEGQIYPDVLP